MLYVEEVMTPIPTARQSADDHSPAAGPVEGDGPSVRGGRGGDARGGGWRRPEAGDEDVDVRGAPPGVQLCLGHVNLSLPLSCLSLSPARHAPQLYILLGKIILSYYQNSSCWESSDALTHLQHVQAGGRLPPHELPRLVPLVLLLHHRRLRLPLLHCPLPRRSPHGQPSRRGCGVTESARRLLPDSERGKFVPAVASQQLSGVIRDICYCVVAVAVEGAAPTH